MNYRIYQKQKKLNRKATLLLLCMTICAGLNAQFGPQQVLNSAADEALFVYAIDLDNDGDMDVLSASELDDTIAWYENLGNGQFSQGQVISDMADGATCVHAVDLDGDMDADVLSSSNLDDKVAWYENLGDGNFGPEQIISENADGAESVYTADLDGDGDQDILSASRWDSKFAWYENLGNGSFGPEQLVTSGTESSPWEVTTDDIDNDGDQDVIGVVDGHIYTIENLGAGEFGEHVEIGYAFYMRAVCSSDFDGDGDIDIIGCTYELYWYENQGDGTYAEGEILDVQSGTRLSAADLDNDGDDEILVADQNSGSILVYYNIGNGEFASVEIISSETNLASSVHAADLDGDGDLEVLSSSRGDDKIAWYENLSISTNLDQIDLVESLNVFPNPVSDGRLIIESEKIDLKDVLMRLENMNGKPIPIEIDRSANKSTVRFNTLAAGQYILSISSPDYRMNKKIIIEK